jgi:hypothetical protein
MIQQLENIPLPPLSQISHSSVLEDIPLPPGPMPQPSLQEDALPPIPIFPWAENSRSVVVDNSEIGNAEEADCNVRISIVNESVKEAPGRSEEEVVPSTSTSPESITTESDELENSSSPTPGKKKPFAIFLKFKYDID